METYDVVIVGAAVSGSVAARTLSDQGLSVLVIEKEDTVGGANSRKVDVAEVFGLKGYVEKLGVKPLCVTHKSLWHAPSGDVFEIELKQEDCYLFKRGSAGDSLENQLMTKAIAKGVEINLGWALVDIKKKERQSTVTISNGKEKKEILTKTIIGADGMNSVTARLGDFPPLSKRTVTGYGIHAEDLTDVTEGVPEVYFSKKYLPGGYLYIAPVSNQEATIVGVYDSKKIGASKDAKAVVNAFIENNPSLKEKLAKTKIINEIEGQGIISTPRKVTVKDNILLAGNAAGVMDPLFAYGLKNAIVTGYLAGTTISDTLGSGDLTNLRYYEDTWRKEIGRNLNDGMKLRKVFDKMQDRDFNLTINALHDMKTKQFDFDDAFNQFSYKKHAPVILKSFLRNDVLGSMSLGAKVLRHII